MYHKAHSAVCNCTCTVCTNWATFMRDHPEIYMREMGRAPRPPVFTPWLTSAAEITSSTLRYVPGNSSNWIISDDV